MSRQACQRSIHTAPAFSRRRCPQAKVGTREVLHCIALYDASRYAHATPTTPIKRCFTDMDAPIPGQHHTRNPARHSRRLPAILASALVALLALAVIGCANPAAQPATVSYESTVQALIPSVAPTTAPTAAPDASTAATEPPAPAATLRPTYTPRPLPTRAVEGERQPAPLFQAVLLDGGEFDLADTLGTPTLVVFWAPW